VVGGVVGLEQARSGLVRIDVPALAEGGEDPADLGERDRRVRAGGESLMLSSRSRGFGSLCVAAHARDRGRHRVRSCFPLTTGRPRTPFAGAFAASGEAWGKFGGSARAR
jgi:hypothetical protein